MPANPIGAGPSPGGALPGPRIIVFGLAPAAHGANRTGRVFTGDRSGDFLFAALYRAGLANQAVVDAADGLTLRTPGCAAVRCAPPANAPTPAERSTCSPWLVAEWRLIGDRVRVVLALGGFAWRAALDGPHRWDGAAPAPKFGHGATAPLKTAHGRGVARVLPPQPAEHLHRKAHAGQMDEVFTLAKREAGL